MKTVLLPPSTKINGTTVEQLTARLKAGEVHSYWYLLIGVDIDPVLLYKGRCFSMTVAPDDAGVYVQVPEFISDDFVSSHYHALWIVHPSVDPIKFFEDWKEQIVSEMPPTWYAIGFDSVVPRVVIDPVTTVPLEDVIEQPNTQPI